MNFKYSPGLPGYGAVGSNGLDGLQGLALYFTDYVPSSDFDAIIDRISKNEVLWRTAAPGTKLPADRKYKAGDLFLDNRGMVYEITLNPADFFRTPGTLTKTGFFTTDPAYTDNGYTRYYNVRDGSKCLIDVNRTHGQNYLFPNSIYGINLNDFNRIEYADPSLGNKIGFSLFSSAEVQGTDEHKALALIYDTDSFRIGNTNDSGNDRNTSIQFDFDNLYRKIGANNQFHLNTEYGTILTGREIKVPLLFDPNFEGINVPGFANYGSEADSMTIFWNLSDFTSESGVKGDLYFWKKQGSTSLNDVSTSRPIIFHNVGDSGYVTINGLNLYDSCYYKMLLYKNGWERSSEVFDGSVGSIPYYIIVKDPDPPILNVYDDGRFYNNGLYSYPVDISAYVSLSGWGVSSSQPWITFNPATPTGGTGTFDDAFSIFAALNPDYFSRDGLVTIKGPSTLPKAEISIHQDRRAPISHSIYMTTYVSTTSDAKGRVNINPPLSPGQTASITLELGVETAAHATSSHRPLEPVVALQLWKISNYGWGTAIKVADVSIKNYSWSELEVKANTKSVTVPGLVQGDVIEVRRAPDPNFQAFEYTSGYNAYANAKAYMDLQGMNDGWDTFTVDTTRRYWSVQRIGKDSGTGNPPYSSWVGDTPVPF